MTGDTGKDVSMLRGKDRTGQRLRRCVGILLAATLTGALTACSDTPGAPEAARESSGSTEAEMPTDATLANFCYAINGIRFLGDGTTADVIVERVTVLTDTGTAAEAPPGSQQAIKALRDAVAQLGEQVTYSDLDPIEASDAPSPFDDPESGLVGWAEDNCDGVYQEEFSSGGQGENEDVLDNQVWLRNQYIVDGDCERLPELYTSDSDTSGLVEECQSGTASAYDLVGGGVTGPDSADLVIQDEDGSEFSTDAMREGGVWKLTWR